MSVNNKGINNIIDINDFDIDNLSIISEKNNHTLLYDNSPFYLKIVNVIIPFGVKLFNYKNYSIALQISNKDILNNLQLLEKYIEMNKVDNNAEFAKFVKCNQQYDPILSTTIRIQDKVTKFFDNNKNEYENISFTQGDNSPNNIFNIFTSRSECSFVLEPKLWCFKDPSSGKLTTSVKWFINQVIKLNDGIQNKNKNQNHDLGSNQNGNSDNDIKCLI